MTNDTKTKPEIFRNKLSLFCNNLVVFHNVESWYVAKFVEIGMFCLVFIHRPQPRFSHYARLALFHILVHVYTGNSKSWKNTGGNE